MVVMLCFLSAGAERCLLVLRHTREHGTVTVVLGIVAGQSPIVCVQWKCGQRGRNISFGAVD